MYVRTYNEVAMRLFVCSKVNMQRTIINCLISEESFLKSIEILIQKPHVINKRLWGCKTLLDSYCKCLKHWEEVLQVKPERLNPTLELEQYKKYLYKILLFEEHLDVNSEADVRVVLSELLPKSFSEKHAYQLIVIFKRNSFVMFHDVTPKNQEQNLCPEFTYTLVRHKSGLQLNADCDDSSKTHKWLKDTVLSHLLKWAKEQPSKTENFCSESLSLVSSDKYYKIYNELKIKYGKEMVKIWPECTDPAKFVYEDIAIATYLLLLWEDKGTQNLKQKSFVDLGCGNGLLVYILTKEGHKGLGIDVRKRNIWDMYPKDVQLEEKTIIPSNAHLFPDTDWIIGNHSDELTPWIPIIAARSSYKCNFFLLPCCAFNFDGSKYQRQNSSLSQYTEYMQYIKQLCEDCGFNIQIDRLKIPSTKRMCLVGRHRNYPETDFSKHCSDIQKLINRGLSTEVQQNGTWTADFKARDAVERVKNCTKIEKTLIESIVNTISSHLLRSCSLDSSWSPGAEMDLSEIVKLIPPEKLKLLKSECGGLQTLLRNNHHIFKVQHGKVQLRHPITVDEVLSLNRKGNKIKLKVRQKPCWFYNNHPLGCPLTDKSCSFLHVKS